MVCIPCIVVPVLLWVFHKFIQPFILKFWNPWRNKSVLQNGTVPHDVNKELPEYKFIEEKITEHPVLVFAKTTCKFCDMAKNVLEENNVVYDIEYLDKREDCSAVQDMLQKLTGARTVPRVFIGKKCIGGGSDAWSLQNQNQLIPMVKEAGGTIRDTESKKKD